MRNVRRWQDGTLTAQVGVWRIRIKPVPGDRWLGTSGEFRGLMVTGDTPEEVCERAPAAIAELRAEMERQT
jgi:predicted RNase H-like HicB family nuclease